MDFCSKPCTSQNKFYCIYFPNVNPALSAGSKMKNKLEQIYLTILWVHKPNFGKQHLTEYS
jgi:hypothetical protein